MPVRGRASLSVLSGIRVVEVSASGAAAFAGRHFAAWGATVISLEPPGGSALRDAPPHFSVGQERRSARWEWLSRGKQFAEVGSSELPSPRAALELAGRADVLLVESELCEPVLGLSAAMLESSLRPTTSVVLITPFSLAGPYAGYRATDLGIHALGGWCNIIGDPGKTPLRPGFDMMYRLQGVCALVAALASLRSRDLGSRAPFAQVDGQAVAATMTVAPWLMMRMLGIQQDRRANDWLQGGVMQCSDGWAGCTPLTATHWELMCQLMGMDEILEDPAARDPAWRWAHSRELLERARPFLGSASKLDVFQRAQAWRIPAAAVEDISERLDCPQLEARGFWEHIEVDGRRVKAPRIPYLIAGQPPDLLGPSTARGSGEEGDSSLSRPDSELPPQPPMAGLRVLDLTHFWAGPYATSLMAALGADVIKVESIQHPDAFRYTFAPAQLDQWWERSPTWQDTNCGKRGITLDLASADGSRIFTQLCERADVVVSNFSNRVMANLGFDDERLHQINPRLIVVALPGYGPGGPWEDYVGFGIAFEQLAVCASITGYEGGVPRIMSGFCDPLAGLHAVAATLLALRTRDATGHGSAVEAPQCETLDSLFAPEHIAVQMGAPVPSQRGNRHEWMAPHNCYPVAGEDRWLSIAVANDAEFQSLCAVLNLPLCADPRFSTMAGRKTHELELDGLLAEALAGRDGHLLEKQLQAAGVMACRVAKGWELPDDPDLASFDFFQPVSRKLTGTHPYKTWPFRFAGLDTSHRRPAPFLGEHNEEVLGDLLGLSLDQIAGLAESGVIGARPLGA